MKSKRTERSWIDLSFNTAVIAIAAVCWLSALRVMAQQPLNSAEHILHVKFKEQFTPAPGQSNRISISGLRPLDRFNKQNNVSVLRRLFPEAGKFERAHRAFGLHLWYEIRLPDKLPIEDVVRQYRSFSYFETVEERKEYVAGKYSEAALMALGTPTHDPYFSEQWHFRNALVKGADISLVNAWKMETGSRDVIVAVIDGGIDATHPDLHDAMWTNSHEIADNGIDDDQNGYVDDIHGFNFGDNTPTIYANKHATHVAGTIGAVTNNGIGVAGIAGGSGSGDGVRLMNCVGFGVTNDGGFETAMVYAADNGAVISQNSWGGGSSAIEAAIDYFVARAGLDNTNQNFNKNIQTGPMAGGIVVFAAGNSNSDNPAVGYPASLEQVIAVGSTDIRDERSSFSNYGPWVDICAPGTDVLSTFPQYNGSYGNISGTSMACPHVSGVAALIVSKYRGATLRPSFVRSQLLQTCDNVPATRTGVMGAGRLNATRALLPLDKTPPGQITDLGYRVLTQSSTTLAWTAPGSDGQIGAATSYDVRISIFPITEENFDTWTKLAENMVPAAAGTTETFFVDGLHYPEYYFAVKAIDFFGNKAAISNNVHITLPDQPPILAFSSSLTQDVYAGRTAVAQLKIDNIAAPGAADLAVQVVNTYPWLKPDPRSFAAKAGTSTNVPIYFDAKGDYPGTLQGQVVIKSNDPLYPDWNVARVDVTMNVIPAPAFDVSTSNIAFGSTYVLQPKDTFIQVFNKGNLPLNFGAITSDNPNFSATVSQGVLDPGMQGTLKITFTPPNDVAQAGIITILSNDPGNGNVNINVSGKGVLAPSVNASISAIDLSLGAGDNTVIPIVLSNNGDSNLNWRAIVSAPGNYIQSETEVFAVGDVTVRAGSPVEMSWLTTDPNRGLIYAMGADNILYLYNPALNVWTNLSASPRPAIGAGVYLNDRIYTFSSGAQRAMLVYGLSSETWEVMPVSLDVSNMTSDGTSLYASVGSKLYRWSAPDTWDQLASVPIFYGMGGLAYHKGVIYAHLVTSFTVDDNTPMMKYFVEQDIWQEATRLTGKAKLGIGFNPSEGKYYVPTLNDSEIAIYDLETDTWTKVNDPQFQGMKTGIYANAPGASGVYISTITKDFVRLETSSSLPWIAVAPSMGKINPGGNQSVNVSLDTKTLTGGEYHGIVKFASVSNSNLNVLVPVKLTVTGVPKLVINSNSFQIRPTFVNEQGAGVVEMRNAGNALLHVTSIVADNPDFTADISALDLQPGQKKTITIYFNPSAPGTRSATFTFAINDVAAPLKTWNISAVGLIPPAISLSPSSLSITAFAGSVVKQDVLVLNTGGSDLEISAYGFSRWLYGSDGGALVAPGATRVIQAIADAARPLGTYTDNFAVSHHFDRFQTSIPVTLTVVSAPGIRPALAFADVGSVFVHEHNTIAVTFSNLGDQTLTVTGVAVSDPQLALGSYSNTVLPGQSLLIPLTFTPTSVGDFNGQITVTSNDPDDGVMVLPVKGTGITRPHAEVDVVSLTAALFSGDVVTKHVTLKNTGGHPMTWSATTQFNSIENAWMSVSPSNGIIAPGEQTDLMVALNMLGLGTSNFSGKISFTTDADNSLSLPVSINTTDTSPILQGDPIIAFYGVALHKTQTKWNIKNVGLSKLEWRFLTLPDYVTPNKAGGSLTPGQSDVITLYLDGLPDAGGFYTSFIVSSNQQGVYSSTFALSWQISPNLAPAVVGFPENLNIKLNDPPAKISLSGITDPEGDRLTVATLSQFPAIAEASISNSFLVIKPVSVGTTQIAVGARDIFGAQAQTIFRVVVSPGATVTGLEDAIAPLLEVTAAPNPFDKNITIKFEPGGPVPAIVTLHDINGRIVWSSETRTGEVTVDNVDLAAGIYLIRITREGKWYGAARVIKQ